MLLPTHTDLLDAPSALPFVEFVDDPDGSQRELLRRELKAQDGPKAADNINDERLLYEFK